MDERERDGGCPFYTSTLPQPLETFSCATALSTASKVAQPKNAKASGSDVLSPIRGAQNHISQDVEACNQWALEGTTKEG
jgi:hypothetical protein